MRVVLSRSGLMAVMASLALALVAAMVVSATAAQAQQGIKRGYCHSTQSATNPYVLVVVQKGGPGDVAHESHLAGGSQQRTPPDIFLGEGNSRDDFSIDQCPGGGTTTGTDTTTTGTDTTTTGTDTTTTGTDTTTTGTDTTGTDTTGTDTTGTDTTGTDTTGTDTTGTDGTTTGATTSATTGATTSATTGATTSVTTGATTSVTTTGDDFEKKYYEKYYYDKDYDKYFYYKDYEKDYGKSYYDKYFYDKASDKYYYYKDDAAPSVEYEKAPAAVQYEYSAPEDTPKAEGELPETGGSSLLAVGAMVLLLGGGLTALFVVRRGDAG